MFEQLAQNKSDFWLRQYQTASTPKQRVFDVIFGILMPVFCFYFDPFILKGEGFMALSSIQIFFYVLTVISIATLLCWLLFGHRITGLSPVAAGIFLAAALCSFLLGIVILPLSLIGLFYLLIGLLGFTPFFTAFVYYRNAVRALKFAAPCTKRAILTGMVCLSALLAIGLSTAVNWKASQMLSQSMNEVLTEEVVAANAIQRIKLFSWLVNTDEIVEAYEKESNPSRKETLANAYREITGNDIERRLAILND